jgi:hypothetical protein
MATRFRSIPSANPELARLLQDSHDRTAVEGARANDTQVGGDHYRKKSVQPWDAMQSWMTPEQFSGYLLGGTFKYLARYREKGGVTDLEKARHTLDKLIEVEKEIGVKKP